MRSVPNKIAAARRFFVEGAKQIGDVAEIGGADAHKIEHVLRLVRGDEVTLIDSTARTFSASIEELGPGVRVRVVAEIEQSRAGVPALRVDLAQAIPKGSRMDFVVEKGTELGVGAFLPFYSERSIGRGVGAEKIARWRRLARTAAQQCGRLDVPEIAEPVSFETLAGRFKAYDAVLFAWELAAPAPLAQRLSELLQAAGRALVVVGPEGGFSHAEAELAARGGAALLWLGARVLRTDTAALVLLAVIGASVS